MGNESQKKYIKKITGDNVYLSPISLDDTEQYTHMINDLKVSVGIGHPAYINIMDYEREREFLNSIKDGKIFAVRLIENDELLGNIELFNVNILQKNAVLGIMLGNPEYQRKGYGKEAINLILDYGFSFLNLYSVSLTVFEYNEVAYNLYKKVGFKEVGRLRKRVEIMGKRYDEIIMDILKEEFESVYIKREIEGRYRL
ncbi:GNAT family N-acetyltransferase [Pseudoleptotrichia goodfellowii]|uniref:N-acetyltransferase GCN5 n=1 Tax=Pseudoleptotrichia goodfellowii TaxID=157692 RepID=A0A510JCF0_9FUSO|nr:GNAT family protein [Pseudoleptotrichia goodfellowii]BBM36884.1 N-acetyltransferase GCN5 [Pseudoleptotrichia goodfellowii]